MHTYPKKQLNLVKQISKQKQICLLGSYQEKFARDLKFRRFYQVGMFISGVHASFYSR